MTKSFKPRHTLRNSSPEKVGWYTEHCKYVAGCWSCQIQFENGKITLTGTRPNVIEVWRLLK